MGSSSSIVGDTSKEKSQSYQSNSTKTIIHNNIEKNEKIIDNKYNNIDLDSPTIHTGLLSNDSPSDLIQFSYKTLNDSKIKSNKSDTPPIQPGVFPNDLSPLTYITLNDNKMKSNKSDSTNGLITEQLLYELSKLSVNNINDNKIKSNKSDRDKHAATVEYEYDTNHSKSFQIQPENYDQIFLERRHSSSVTPNNHSSNTVNYTNSTVIHMSRKNSLNVSTKEPNSNELLCNFNPLDRIDSTIDLDCPSSIAIHCGLCNVTFDDEEKYYYHLNFSKQHWILLQENINK